MSTKLQKSKSQTTVIPKRGSATLKLEYPMEWGDELIEEITITRPKAKHLSLFSDEDRLGSLILIAQQNSEYTPAFFEELDISDGARVADMIAGFLENGQKTGKTAKS